LKAEAPVPIARVLAKRAFPESLPVPIAMEVIEHLERDCRSVFQDGIVSASPFSANGFGVALGNRVPFGNDELPFEDIRLDAVTALGNCEDLLPPIEVRWFEDTNGLVAVGVRLDQIALHLLPRTVWDEL